MTANIRRLAFDISPWLWAYIIFWFCMIAFMDSLWLTHAGLNPSLIPGILGFLCAGFTAQKVRLWRTLPVTRIQIDRARWWQGVAGPALMICTACLGPALVMNALGLRREAWSDVALLVLAQSATCALFTGVIFVALPLAAKGLGRWSALLLVPYMLLFMRINMPLNNQTDVHALLWAVIAVGLTTAIALYTLAGRLPMPLTTALWAVPSKDRTSQERATMKTSGLRGWPILVWGNLPIFAILLASSACIPLIMKWFLPNFDVSAIGWLTCVLALQVAVSGIATAMRTLRALPLSGGQLTCRLVFFVLLVQAISLATFRVVLLVAGEQARSPAIFLMLLAYSLVYLPFGLRFGLLALQFGLMLSLIFIIPVQIFAPYYDASLWIIVGSLFVMAIGFTWTYLEIARGHSAYRVQPLVPARWSGLR